jgi:hypothetical protein
VAVVVGHVVDEHAEIAERLRGVPDRQLHCRDVGDVCLPEPRTRVAVILDPFHERLRRGFRDVDERDQRALSREGFGETAAYPRAPTGDEHAASAQRRVAGSARQGGGGIATIDWHPLKPLESAGTIICPR